MDYLWTEGTLGSPAGGAPGVTADVKVVIAATEREREDAFSVRIAVFVDEQGISPSDELDEHDATATHCVAYDGGGAAVGAGRACIEADLAKIGRMCVLSESRGHGIGAAVLAALERIGVDQGARRFKLSAQLHARGFYERCGYRAYGDVYDDVGIPHIDMVKELT